MTPAHLTTVAIRTALVENPPGKVPMSSGLVMIERGTQPNGDRIPGDTHFSRKGVSLWASRPSEGECAETAYCIPHKISLRVWMNVLIGAGREKEQELSAGVKRSAIALLQNLG